MLNILNLPGAIQPGCDVDVGAIVDEVFGDVDLGSDTAFVQRCVAGVVSRVDVNIACLATPVDNVLSRRNVR